MVPILEDDKIKEKNSKKATVVSSQKKAETKPTPKGLEKRKQIKADSLTANDAKSMLNEMLGELDD
jgi:hypothetical protein